MRATNKPSLLALILALILSLSDLLGRARCDRSAQPVEEDFRAYMRRLKSDDKCRAVSGRTSVVRANTKA